MEIQLLKDNLQAIQSSYCHIAWKPGRDFIASIKITYFIWTYMIYARVVSRVKSNQSEILKSF